MCSSRARPSMRLHIVRRVQLAWPRAQGEARRTHAANEAMLRAWASDAAATVLSCLTVHTAAQVLQHVWHHTTAGKLCNDQTAAAAGSLNAVSSSAHGGWSSRVQADRC